MRNDVNGAEGPQSLKLLAPRILEELEMEERSFHHHSRSLWAPEEPLTLRHILSDETREALESLDEQVLDVVPARYLIDLDWGAAAPGGGTHSAWVQLDLPNGRTLFLEDSDWQGIIVWDVLKALASSRSPDRNTGAGEFLWELFASNGDEFNTVVIGSPPSIIRTDVVSAQDLAALIEAAFDASSIAWDELLEGRWGRSEDDAKLWDEEYENPLVQVPLPPSVSSKLDTERRDLRARFGFDAPQAPTSIGAAMARSQQAREATQAWLLPRQAELLQQWLVRLPDSVSQPSLERTWDADKRRVVSRYLRAVLETT